MAPKKKAKDMTIEGLQAQISAAETKVAKKRGRPRKDSVPQPDVVDQPKAKRGRKAAAAEDVPLAAAKVKAEKEPEVPVPSPKWKNEPHLTQKILGFIEPRERCRTSLNMSKGTGEDAGEHDEKTQTAWFKEIAVEVLQKDPSGRWAEFDAERLFPVIRNRIGRLRTKFVKCQKLLGETGSGIVMDDREDELAGNFRNIWDQVLGMCPEYKRLHALLASSPVYDKSACSNSGTALDSDLSILLRQSSTPSTENLLEINDSDADDDELESSERGTSLPPVAALFGSDDIVATPIPKKAATTTVPAKTKVETKTETKGPVQNAGQKRRNNMLSAIEDINAKQSDMLLSVTKMKLGQKATQEAAERAARFKEAEAARQFQREEAELGRAHEREMMDKKLELVRIQHGQPMAMGMGNSGAMGNGSQMRVGDGSLISLLPVSK
ncbi:hypothetical protein FB45DRAFT_1087610 [Roridomyces roridus]|uniref:Uncharacterized protein n=1 Tax=Roridomyces roridus TaxID=1738132 RepID=A0AAD7AYB3_9AGAR|nr:hypothetical protein FB45DRAFT_1087610 [Roridomyces roridus]